MPQQALYRKWRSQSFTDLVGQEHIVRTLQNAIQGARVRHAYLFTGPRGTGKTSSARILAKAVNCEVPESERPCNRCRMCRSITDGSSLDLIEIDAASNTGVDKVRDTIIEKVNFAPSEGRYKVYIIDEVHMLSTSAFNALLKTLEEPPPYALFILATTEVHKVPATILSRCQRLDFRRISIDKIAGHLAYILEQEGIEAEPGVLELVARQATGSMRDAQSLLDQLLAFGGDSLTLDGARQALGLATGEAVLSLTDRLLAHDVGGALALLHALFDQGVDPRQFLLDVLEYLRQLLLAAAGESGTQAQLPSEVVQRLRAQAGQLRPAVLVEVIKLFNQAGADMRLGLQPQLPFELAVVEVVLKLQSAGHTPASIQPAAVVPTARPSVTQTQKPRPGPAVERTRDEPVPMPRADGREGGESRTVEKPQPAAREPVEQSPPPSPPAALDEPPPFWDESLVEPAGRAPHESPRALHEPPAAPLEPAPDPAGAGDASSTDWWLLNWQSFLAGLRERDATGRRLATRLKFSEPRQVEGDVLVLGFFYSIHRDKIEETEARRAVEQALAAFCGRRRVFLKCELAPARPVESQAKTKYEAAAEDPVVRAAMRLGGRIVDVRLPDQP